MPRLNELYNRRGVQSERNNNDTRFPSSAVVATSSTHFSFTVSIVKKICKKKKKTRKSSNSGITTERTH